MNENSYISWLQVLSYGFWVFVGIIAGTLVTLFTSLILVRLKKKKIKKNIKFEISFNIEKIQKWKGLLDEVLVASNSDSIKDCFVFFNFQEIILWTVNKTISDGTLYDYIDQESIITLQTLSGFCTAFSSKRINDEIRKFKNSPDKAGVAKMVKLWKAMLDKHKTNLKQIESKL